MSAFFITHVRERQACLKIINNHGRELSVSFKDPLFGSVPILDRVQIVGFDEPVESLEKRREDLEKHVNLRVDYASEEDFLHALADHLGYDLVKR